MKKLLTIEFSKLKKLASLYILFGVYALMIPLIIWGLNTFFQENPDFKMLLSGKGNLYSFPYIWEVTTYAASFVNILMCVIIVIITCNEIHFKTMRQNVIEGLEKGQVIVSKLIIILLMAIGVTLYTFIVGLIFGSINSGIGEFTNGIGIIGKYFLQVLGYFSFAFLFAIIVKRPALSIILYIAYFPVETIVGLFLPREIYLFFPLKTYADLTPFPFLKEVLKNSKDAGNPDIWIMPENLKLGLAFAFITSFFLISYWVLRKRDL